MTTSKRLASTLALAAALGVLAPPASAEPGVIRDAHGCRFYNPSPKPDEQVTWTGSCRDGWGDGQGTLSWMVNGVPTYIYTGMVAAGKLEGDGVENIRGDHYEGHFVDGHRQGRGIFTWHDGVRYEGDFVRGQMEGQGVLQMSDGARFEGRFANNLLQAPVTLTKTIDGVVLRLPMEMPDNAMPAASPTSAASAAAGPRVDAMAPCKPRYPVAALTQGATGASKFSLQIDPSAQVTRVRLDQRSGADFAHQMLDLASLAALLDCPRRGGAPGTPPEWVRFEYRWRLE